MVFQLEEHDIPERFHKEDFLVQVALRVGTKEGSIVPSNLEEARTASKDEATMLYTCSYTLCGKKCTRILLYT